jgi:hypothetical protein
MILLRPNDGDSVNDGLYWMPNSNEYAKCSCRVKYEFAVEENLGNRSCSVSITEYVDIMTLLAEQCIHKELEIIIVIVFWK